MNSHPTNSPLPTRTAPRLARPVTALGWGAFKIGRNEAIKYPTPYALPSEEQAIALVHAVIELGIRLIDTAPAYGLSEARVGLALAQLAPAVRSEIFLSTKAGEQFADGHSHYDFTAKAITQSISQSLTRLRCERIDLAWIHSDGTDLEIIGTGEAVEALALLKRSGTIGAIGFSPKSIDGAHAALERDEVDAIMIELHEEIHENVALLAKAYARGKAVFVKKPLRSGRLDPAVALPRILAHPHVTAIVIGGLSLDRLRANTAIVRGCATP